jgi:SAM-dependent methyltransferase
MNKEKSSFTVNSFSYIRKNDNCDLVWKNWSRCYEYVWILNKLEEYKFNFKSIHNTACGGCLPIHKQFADELCRLGQKHHFKVVNSDNMDPKYHKKKPFKFIPLNFHKYDLITDEGIQDTFDIILNISTIEHFPTNESIIKCMNNMLNKLNPGGKLLLTFDYPDINIGLLESFFKAKCLDVQLTERLCGENSPIPDKNYTHLNIIYLEVTKN